MVGVGGCPWVGGWVGVHCTGGSGRVSLGGCVCNLMMAGFIFQNRMMRVVLMWMHL